VWCGMCVQTSGATPLYIASQKGHVECVQALLRGGAALNQELVGRANSMTCRCWRFVRGSIGCCMHACVAVPPCRLVRNDSTVGLGCASHVPEVARAGPICHVFFLGHDVLQSNGATPLYVASQNGHVECVRALLGGGAASSQAKVGCAHSVA
jgi:ankyrin repeat protein